MNRFLFAAAAMALGLAAGCTKEESNIEPPAQGGSLVIEAIATTGDESKICFGGKTIAGYSVTWDTAESFNLSEFVNSARSQDVASTGFVRDPQNPKSGSISFSLTTKSDSGTYDYVAITPQSAARTTGTAAAKKGRASFAIVPDTPQTPLADAPDPAVCVMVASDLGRKSRPKALNLNFTHCAAYGRMTVTDFPALEPGETLTNVRVSVSDGHFPTGRMWYSYATDVYELYDGSQKTYLNINPANVTVGDSFTLWFGCLPFGLEQGEWMEVSATTSAGRTLKSRVILSGKLDFTAGRVSEFKFKWGKCQDKVLTFDFSKWPTGWPDKLANGVAYKYGDYSFTHWGYVDGATSTTRCTHKKTTPDFMVLNNLGFLSLPAIPGYRLTKAVVTHSATKSSTRYGGIVYGTRTLADSVEFVTAKAKSSALWNVEPGTDVELPILTGLAGHQYYLCCSGAGLGISKLELTYVYDPGADLSHQSDAVTVGTLNIWQPSARTSAKEAGTAAPEREWEYARYNIRDIILDSGFDILGVQEATLRVRNDIQSDLKASGKYAFQFFLHKPSVSASSSSVGIVYNKSRFSISDTHHFWLSDTPDVSESQYATESNVRSVGCAIMNDLQTGRKYFVMVAHASLDDACNDKDGQLLLDRIKLYNTGNLPVILVGDMNANWDMQLYRTLSSWCDDCRFAVELDRTEYTHPGSHNSAGGVYENLKNRARRLDYVFVRGCNVYSYKVNRSKYSAGSTLQFPSDHCPVMVDLY